ncbi:hypothetical protein [endosymbiont GvMRE of Glomus versiforme]|uniref:hypothetical protein n=1 Tax=endosymbiont GvMRE of Glomus versiforme TaxID=2039283 RepID=UPI0011C4215C|nr:hypothetical protein [endosymbiont GvMRE of Glomus versiforme]
MFTSWFLIPYLVFIFGLREATESFRRQNFDTSIIKKVDEIESFYDFNHFFLKDTKIFREKTEKLMKEEIENMKECTDEVKLANIRLKMRQLEFLNEGGISGVNFLHYSNNNCFFFCKSGRYSKWKDFLRLINGISWQNLTGLISLFWLVFNVVDNVFFDPQKNGEEADILILTSGVRRNDLFWAKILSFLTFYFIANFFLFVLPFGTYYLWMNAFSFSWFFPLLLWTVIIGPILFFGLFLTPYIFFTSAFNRLGWMISGILSFSPFIWGSLKIFFVWPFAIEKYFFDPFVFISFSLICGIIFLSAYYWWYEIQDL